VTGHPLENFEQVRIINLVDRSDRRREMIRELARLGGTPPNAAFYDAHRPADAGPFPSVGARGCFESHLELLRRARDAGVSSLMIVEDDLDFGRNARERLKEILPELSAQRWDIFHGAHLLSPNGREGLVQIASDEPVMTTSCVCFNGTVLGPLVDFLEAMLRRPPGSPDYGPMHVDGAYTVFRMLNPERVTLAAFPSLGRQRSSPSDVTPGNMLLDRWTATRPLASLLRRTYNAVRRH
jgi:GR25 family glycosyltransferase involved in LPS biosynthesis